MPIYRGDIIMIMFWNRKEIYVGNSAEKCGQIRSALSANNIKYSYRVVNRNGSSAIGASRVRTGTIGENIKLAYTYYVYIYKSDYDKVCMILSSL